MVQEARHFGAFVELEGGVVGMVSARQVSGGAVKAADQVLRDGDSIKAVVVRVEPEKGRIALSTKYLEPTPGERSKKGQPGAVAWCGQGTARGGREVCWARGSFACSTGGVCCSTAECVGP